MTQGDTPYHLHTDDQVIAHVCGGGRLQLHQITCQCVDGLWDLISSCWSASPEARPTFSELLVGLAGSVQESERNFSQQIDLSAADGRSQKRARCKLYISLAILVLITFCTFGIKDAFLETQKKNKGVEKQSFCRGLSKLAYKNANNTVTEQAMKTVQQAKKKVKAAKFTQRVLQQHLMMEQDTRIKVAEKVERKRKEVEVALKKVDEEAMEEVETERKSQAAVEAERKRKEAETRIQAERKTAAQEFAISIISGMMPKTQKDIAFLVRGMESHADSAVVQEPACWFLWNFSVNNDNVVAITAEGGIAAVVAAMSTHTGRAGVQEQCVWALMNLAVNADNQVAIAKQGGIAAVVAAMSTHTGHGGVQKLGAWALKNLAVNADNQVAIAEQGGIAAVVTAMGAHTGNTGVQEHGGRALKNLAVNAGNRVAIAEQGGIAVLIAAMRAHTGHRGADVQEHCTRALLNIGLSQWDLLGRIKREGGREVVKRAMAASNASADTKKWGQKLLDRLQLQELGMMWEPP